MPSDLVDVIAQAIRVADGNHTMGAGELAEVMAGLFEQIEATIVEDLRKTKAERDRLLPFVIQKCHNCGRVTAPLGQNDG